MNTFSFIANIALGKETDKFKPYEEKKFNSGWINRTLKFNAVAGTNRIMCEIKGGSWEDGHGTIKTFAPGTVDDAGKRVKGEPIEIPWKDRTLQSNIDQVAPFRKFIVDLEEMGKRKLLQRIVEDGEVTDETLAEAKVDSLEAAQAALEKSKAKRHEFLSEWDFAAFVYKLLNNEAVKNLKCRVSGNLVMTEYEGKFYQHYEVTRIMRAAADAEYDTEAVITLNFGQNAVDDGSVEEKGIIIRYDMMKYAQVGKTLKPRNELKIDTEYTEGFVPMEYTATCRQELYDWVNNIITEIDARDPDDIDTWEMGENPQKSFFCKQLCSHCNKCLSE